MPITSVPAFPPRTDPGFSAYVNDFFTVKLPQFVDELEATAVGFNNGSFTGTSTSSHTINTTAGKVFVTQAGLSFLKGMWVVVMSTATTDTNNYMICKVNAYSGTSLTLDPHTVNGSGTIASWRITISPPVVGTSTKTEYRLETGAGYGTTNTFVRNFGTATITTGSGVTHALSTTLGASFTIASTGIYAVTYHEPAGAVTMHILKNAASLVAAPAVGERLASSSASAVSTINYVGTLTLNDVIRAHPQTVALTATTGSYFHIVKLD